jgi:hypothetical protein
MIKGKTPRILPGFLVLVLVAIPLLVAACDNGDDDDLTPTPTVARHLLGGRSRSN